MRKFLVCSVLSLSLWPAAGSAATLNFEGLGKAGIVTVGGLFSGTVYAGELNWTWLSGQPSDLPSWIYTYCIDIVNHLTNPQDVTVRSTDELQPPGPGDSLIAYAPGAGEKAAWLLNTFAPAIHLTGTDIQAAALQVALWEVLYDQAYNLAAGNFYMLSNPSVYGGAYAASILGQAQSYLSALTGAGSEVGAASALWLDAPTGFGQDQITQVPEPGLLVMLGVGVLGMAAFFRRRRAGFTPHIQI